MKLEKIIYYAIGNIDGTDYLYIDSDGNEHRGRYGDQFGKYTIKLFSSFESAYEEANSINSMYEQFGITWVVYEMTASLKKVSNPSTSNELDINKHEIWL